MKLHLKALRYGSHRVAPANYTIPASTLRTFARWRHMNGRHLIPARYSFIDLRNQKDERLSWPSWLTYSGRYTHISGAHIRCRSSGGQEKFACQRPTF